MMFFLSWFFILFPICFAYDPKDINVEKPNLHEGLVRGMEHYCRMLGGGIEIPDLKYEPSKTEYLKSKLKQHSGHLLALQGWNPNYRICSADISESNGVTSWHEAGTKLATKCNQEVHTHDVCTNLFKRFPLVQCLTVDGYHLYCALSKDMDWNTFNQK
ncbi:unnamed protein product [Cylicocyclus nassatus]|uniref:Uncharacterized protein n=1 Tax=Cylicocyclus nassatus TaxID=53992 RepID=A0AA36M5B9_CYLNA|nr:unnamed protein product [Cylicocyclus nassatus]